MANWYRSIVADKSTPRAFNPDDVYNNPYRRDPKADPAGHHFLGGKERAGYPRGTQEIDEEENPLDTRGIEDTENLMFIDPEPGIGEGTGYSKLEPHTDPVDKLEIMSEPPEPVGPHNMSSETVSTHNRLTSNEIYNSISRKRPKSPIRNI
jgi:hypothetical protein